MFLLTMGLCIKKNQIIVTTTFSNSLFFLLSHNPNHLGLGLPHQMGCAWSPRACKFSLADLQGKQRSVRSSLLETHFASNTNLSLPINVWKRRPFYPVCERKSVRSAGKEHRVDGHKISGRSHAGRKALTQTKNVGKQLTISPRRVCTEKNERLSSSPGEVSLFYTL